MPDKVPEPLLIAMVTVELIADDCIAVDVLHGHSDGGADSGTGRGIGGTLHESELGRHNRDREKVLETVLVKLPSVARRVYWPRVSILRLLNVATPLTATAVNVPERVPLPLARAIVTVELSVETTLPLTSSTATVIAGEIAVLTLVVVGSWREGQLGGGACRGGADNQAVAEAGYPHLIRDVRIEEDALGRNERIIGHLLESRCGGLHVAAVPKSVVGSGDVCFVGVRGVKGNLGVTPWWRRTSASRSRRDWWSYRFLHS